MNISVINCYLYDAESVIVDVFVSLFILQNTINNITKFVSNLVLKAIS